MKDLILFGTGNTGKEALSFFGEEHVFCFSTNNRQKIGGMYLGKKVIDPIELPSLSDKYEIIVCVIRTKEMMLSVISQLRNMGIRDFSIYSDILKYYNKGIDFLKRDTEKAPVEQESLWEIERQQLDYIIRHTDRHKLSYYGEQLEKVKKEYKPSELSPATGDLRAKQLWVVDQAATFLNEIERKTGIRVALTGGNLLGAVRNGGFIPWDDDLDFVMMYSEFYKLENYLKEQEDIIFYPHWPITPIEREEMTEKCYRTRGVAKRYVILNNCGLLNVRLNIGIPNFFANPTILDIVPQCFYPETMTDEQYIEEARYWTQLRKIDFASVDRLVQEELKDINKHPIKSGLIGEAFDLRSAMAWGQGYSRGIMDVAGTWNYDDLCPFKTIEFEGITFYSPHNPDGLLRRAYGENYMDYPSLVGFTTHGNELT